MPDMPDLIEILESFNRKERFFLVAQALGNPKFELSTGFREKLAKAVDLERGIEIPANAFAAMDYHLDWVAAGLAKWQAETSSIDAKCVFCNPGEGQEKLVRGSQEDTDLLVAFYDGGNYRLIFVEAKAYDGDGYASFDRSQLKSKANRLEEIFGKDGQKYKRVKPYFCLFSKNQPKPKTPYKWPWHKDQWLPVTLPRRDTRRIVERCNENGEVAAYGNYFSVKFLKGE